MGDKSSTVANICIKSVLFIINSSNLKKIEMFKIQKLPKIIKITQR